MNGARVCKRVFFSKLIWAKASAIFYRKIKQTPTEFAVRPEIEQLLVIVHWPEFLKFLCKLEIKADFAEKFFGGQCPSDVITG
jgi:hypothetical protein